jgi:hypothetical protein
VRSLGKQTTPQKRLSSVSCPLCGRMFRVRTGKPRTLKQWKVTLMVHLIASPRHYKEPEEAESMVDAYLRSM